MLLIKIVLGVICTLPSFAFAVQAERSVPLTLIREGDSVQPRLTSSEFAWSERGECLQNFSGTWQRTSELVCAPYVHMQLADGNCYEINGYGSRRRQVLDSLCAENYVSFDSDGHCVDNLPHLTFVVQIYTGQDRCAAVR